MASLMLVTIFSAMSVNAAVDSGTNVKLINDNSGDNTDGMEVTSKDIGFHTFNPNPSLTLTPSLRVYVEDRDNKNPVNEAIVSVQNGNTNLIIHTVFTNADGYTDQINLDPGKYVVYSVAPSSQQYSGYWPGYATISLSESDGDKTAYTSVGTEPEDFKFSVSGKVKKGIFGEGIPNANVRITAKPYDMTGTQIGEKTVYTTVTDENGLYRIDNVLSPCRLSFKVTAEDYKSAGFTLEELFYFPGEYHVGCSLRSDEAFISESVSSISTIDGYSIAIPSLTGISNEESSTSMAPIVPCTRLEER